MLYLCALTAGTRVSHCTHLLLHTALKFYRPRVSVIASPLTTISHCTIVARTCRAWEKENGVRLRTQLRWKPGSSLPCSQYTRPSGSTLRVLGRANSWCKMRDAWCKMGREGRGGEEGPETMIYRRFAKATLRMCSSPLGFLGEEWPRCLPGRTPPPTWPSALRISLASSIRTLPPTGLVRRGSRCQEMACIATT